MLICRSAECFQEPPTGCGYLCSDRISAYYIFTSYDSARGIPSMIEKWLDKLREIRPLTQNFTNLSFDHLTVVNCINWLLGQYNVLLVVYSTCTAVLSNDLPDSMLYINLKQVSIGSVCVCTVCTCIMVYDNVCVTPTTDQLHCLNDSSLLAGSNVSIFTAPPHCLH